jgi:glutathione S-transferase
MTSSKANLGRIQLWQYPPGFGMTSLSPFCVKVEAFLKLAGIRYDIRVVNNPMLGPFGKMPVIDVAGELIADSRVIIDAIKRRANVQIDQNLSPAALVMGHALLRMFEEHLYFVIMYSRWVEPGGFAACSSEFSRAFPKGSRLLVMAILRRMLMKQCRLQGVGRLPRETIYQLGLLDLDATEAILTKKFIISDSPTSFDCTIYAFLKTIYQFPVPNPLNLRIEKSESMKSYIDRMDRLTGMQTYQVKD